MLFLLCLCKYFTSIKNFFFDLKQGMHFLHYKDNYNSEKMYGAANPKQ